MIYFDNAATGGFKPDEIINATLSAMKFCANPGRSGHKLSLACLERVYACRKILCEFFGGYDYDRVIFTKNCSEALNTVILGTFREGDEVVTTVAEHNSVLRPLHYLEGKGVHVKYTPLDSEGNIDISELQSLVTQNTRAVILTLASNVTGASPDVSAVRNAIPKECLLICDGAQACGHIKINMKESGIDALAVAGHKGMLAIQGSGALLFSERINPRPITYGGTGSESNNLNMPDFYPDRLECGTLSYPAIISLGEGALYLKNRMAENGQKVVKYTEILHEGLTRIKGISLYSKPNPFGIVCFSLENLQSELAAFRLSDEYSVCVRGGLHCAPKMHQALDSEGLIRASVCSFNSKNECEIFLNAVYEISK